MNREGFAKYIPNCSERFGVAQVDQYSWPEKDFTQRVCENGTSHPIYACNGNISYTLPLHMYPPDYRFIHPQIGQSKNVPHFEVRDPIMGEYIKSMHLDKQNGRLEGFYL